MNCGLERAFELYTQKYPVEDVGHVLKSLVYFLDAEQEPLPNKLSALHWQEIRAYFQRQVLAFR